MNDDIPPLFVLELMAASDALSSGGPVTVPSARRRPIARQPILADLDPHIEPRARRSIEDMQKVINSLLIQGDVIQTGVGRWMIPGNAFEAPRDPLATDDRTDGVRVGSLWVNTESLALWVNLVATENNAVWEEIGTDDGDGLTGTF